MGTSAATPMEPGQRGVLAQVDLGLCKPGARTLGPCNAGRAHEVWARGSHKVWAHEAWA